MISKYYITKNFSDEELIINDNETYMNCNFSNVKKINLIGSNIIFKECNFLDLEVIICSYDLIIENIFINCNVNINEIDILNKDILNKDILNKDIKCKNTQDKKYPWLPMMLTLSPLIYFLTIEIVILYFKYI